MKKVIISMLVISFLLPAYSFAQNEQLKEQRAGYAKGRADATRVITGDTWIIIGFFTGGASWLFPEVFSWNPPQSGMVGKSPAYVAGYTDGYLQTRKNIIQKNSCTGGLVYYGACLLFYVVAAVRTRAALSY
jgi:hypothetical protein